jgi:hypothetical protein
MCIQKSIRFAEKLWFLVVYCALVAANAFVVVRLVALGINALLFV